MQKKIIFHLLIFLLTPHIIYVTSSRVYSPQLIWNSGNRASICFDSPLPLEDHSPYLRLYLQVTRKFGLPEYHLCSDLSVTTHLRSQQEIEEFPKIEVDRCNENLGAILGTRYFISFKIPNTIAKYESVRVKVLLRYRLFSWLSFRRLFRSIATYSNVDVKKTIPSTSCRAIVLYDPHMRNRLLNRLCEQGHSKKSLSALRDYKKIMYDLNLGKYAQNNK